MKKQKTGPTPEHILTELDWMEIGYKKICTQWDGLDAKTILGKGETFVIISSNYATLQTNILTLDKKTVEQMFLFTNV